MSEVMKLADVFQLAKEKGFTLILKYIACKQCQACERVFNFVDNEYSIVGGEDAHKAFEKEYGWRLELDENVFVTVEEEFNAVFAEYVSEQPDLDYKAGLPEDWRNGLPENWDDDSLCERCYAEKNYYHIKKLGGAS